MDVVTVLSDSLICIYSLTTIKGVPQLVVNLSSISFLYQYSKQRNMAFIDQTMSEPLLPEWFWKETKKLDGIVSFQDIFPNVSGNPVSQLWCGNNLTSWPQECLLGWLITNIYLWSVALMSKDQTKHFHLCKDLIGGSAARIEDWIPQAPPDDFCPLLEE